MVEQLLSTMSYILSGWTSPYIQGFHWDIEMKKLFLLAIAIFLFAPQTWADESILLHPDGTYGYGTGSYMRPDGSYGSTSDYMMAPDGTYVNKSETGNLLMHPDGTYGHGTGSYMRPDGSFGSSPDYQLAPDGTYVDK